MSEMLPVLAADVSLAEAIQLEMSEIGRINHKQLLTKNCSEGSKVESTQCLTKTETNTKWPVDV